MQSDKTNIQNIQDAVKAETNSRLLLKKCKQAEKSKKLIPIKVPNDPRNTVFFVKDEKKGKAAVKAYVSEHAKFWNV